MCKGTERKDEQRRLCSHFMATKINDFFFFHSGSGATKNTAAIVPKQANMNDAVLQN